MIYIKTNVLLSIGKSLESTLKGFATNFPRKYLVLNGLLNGSYVWGNVGAFQVY